MKRTKEQLNARVRIAQVSNQITKPGLWVKAFPGVGPRYFLHYTEITYKEFAAHLIALLPKQQYKIVPRCYPLV